MIALYDLPSDYGLSEPKPAKTKEQPDGAWYLIEGAALDIFPSLYPTQKPRKYPQALAPSLSDLSESAYQAVLLEMAACEMYLRDRPVPELPAKTREEMLNGVDVMGDQAGALGKRKQVEREVKT